MEFSDAVTHYSSIFPERTGDYILQLLPENLYQQMTFRTAFACTATLLALYFFLLAMILLFAALCNRKFVGVLLGWYTDCARNCNMFSRFMADVAVSYGTCDSMVTL